MTEDIMPKLQRMAAALHVLILPASPFECTGWLPHSNNIRLEPRDWNVPFVLAHELAHATIPKLRARLLPVQIKGYLRCRPWKVPASVRVEEALADRVAELLTGRARGAVVGHDGAYPPVTPGTMRAAYVQVKAAEAFAYLSQLVESL
jgi:hypothetical protein